MTNVWIDWFHIFIILVNTDSAVMLEILPNNADWDCLKTLTSREILMIQNPLLGEHWIFWKSYVCSNKLDLQETNCRFEQFNRIRNHLFGHRTEIGWVAISGTMGSYCFCSWKCFSCCRSIGATWEWWRQTPQVSQENRCDERQWCCSFKCPIRASRSFLVCFWGQWSCNHDDY